MKLTSFSAKNYRSISTAYKLPLTDYTVIVGPNNEGKSNILKGLGLALTILTNLRNIHFIRPSSRYINYGINRVRRPIYRHGSNGLDRFDYDWERDYPIDLQKTESIGCSEFICEFQLTDKEFIEFKQKTKINLTTNLKVKVTIGKDQEVKIDFLKEGKGKKALNKKTPEVINFINGKLLLQYIPAIRTSELAINIVDNLLERELSTLEQDPEFKKVIKTINKLQQPILKKIAKSLKESISGFIPDVKSISIKNRENVGRLISASCDVYVNDGIETDLQRKGDGVISLTAISLLQHFSKQGSLDKGLILLLEEPESHLHPKAIHSLKKVLYEISNTSQVIVTTHSPIIIERLDIKHNIIVQSGKATPANNVSEIRKSLGITMSDNLSSAYLVLLVEGEEDATLLKSWIVEKSNVIKDAIENATLIIDHLGGATNLSYKTTLHKNNLCNVVAYIDNDECGRKSVTDAEVKNIIKTNEYVLSFCRGMRNSELEDLIEFKIYQPIILQDYGVDLNISAFKNNKKQWSNRVKEIFLSNGKIWSDKIENEIKHKIVNMAAQSKLQSLNSHKTNSIDSLVETIENILVKQK